MCFWMVETSIVLKTRVLKNINCAVLLTYKYGQVKVDHDISMVKSKWITI